jgi:cytochrome bd ubiquinol oxidase subunit I
MGPSGLMAILAGWFTTEIGRQPWVVYGLMRTKDASLRTVLQMSITLIMFVWFTSHCSAWATPT